VSKLSAHTQQSHLGSREVRSIQVAHYPVVGYYPTILDILDKIQKFKPIIQTSISIPDVKDIQAKAEALRRLAKQVGHGLTVQNEVAEIKLMAERKAGELLAHTVKHEGGRPRKRSHDVRVLADLGISWMQSSRWQLEASVPETLFQDYVRKTKETGQELTSVGLLMLAGRLRKPTVVSRNDLPKGKFRCIVIDPPWPMQKIERIRFPLQGRYLDYPTMGLEAIAALPIRSLAHDGCHIFLWTPQRFVPSALELFNTWCLRYECLLTWVKPTGPTPYSWMYNTEHVLFGRNGHLPLQQKGIKISFEERSRKHSRKPDVFYEIVRQVSPEPRLDMFAREPRLGFESWGNEVQQDGEIPYLSES
jgi:N6-adenosine-specific RNA methylase IME4